MIGAGKRSVCTPHSVNPLVAATTWLGLSFGCRSFLRLTRHFLTFRNIRNRGGHRFRPRFLRSGPPVDGRPAPVSQPPGRAARLPVAGPRTGEWRRSGGRGRRGLSVGCRTEAFGPTGGGGQGGTGSLGVDKTSFANPGGGTRVALCHGVPGSSKHTPGVGFRSQCKREKTRHGPFKKKKGGGQEN